MRRRMLVPTLLVLLSLFGANACAAPTPSQPGKPTIVITAPPSGSQFLEGDDIVVQSTASDPAGVVRVELFADGAVARIDPAPTAQGVPSFSVVQTWKAQPGTHSLVVRAVNAAGATSDPAGITVSVLPAPTRATTATEPAGFGTPGASPTPAPSVTSPPAVGSLDGVVTFQFPNDPEKPASNARVEILGFSTLAANADNQGKYRLERVPAGSRFVFAKNQYGESNPVEVNVTGGTNKTVNIRLLPGGGDIGAPTRLYSGRVTRNGQPAAGATVWVMGDIAVTKTNRDGRYWLVHWVRKEIDGVRMRRNPFFVLASDGARWGGVFQAEDENQPVQDVELDRDSPPTPPATIFYDVLTEADRATWTSSSGTLLFNVSPNDPKGSARYRTNIVLEDKSSPDRVLELFPARVQRGFVAGIFPKTFTVQKNDYVYGVVGFLDQATGGDMTFKISLIPAGGGTPLEIDEVAHEFNKKLQPFVSPLQNLAGKSGKLELRGIHSSQPLDANRAIWIDVKIVRGQ